MMPDAISVLLNPVDPPTEDHRRPNAAINPAIALGAFDEAKGWALPPLADPAGLVFDPDTNEPLTVADLLDQLTNLRMQLRAANLNLDNALGLTDASRTHTAPDRNTLA
jgi:hypothetical protein